jgi:hypothetical protein
MKWYERNCLICGQGFASTSGSAKFCPQCRKKAYNRHKVRYDTRKSNDSEAMIQLCLNCTKQNCSGVCKKLAQLAGRTSNGKKCTA